MSEQAGTYRTNPANVAGSLGRRVTIEAAPRSGQCAVHDGPHGWAYRWTHDGLHDPCENCTLRIAGRPLMIAGEIPSDKYAELAGSRIRVQDWIELDKRPAWAALLRRSGLP